MLVRLLVNDDASQTQTARKLLLQHARRSDALFVTTTVALELEWVLRSRYKFSKTEILTVFSTVMSAVELEFEAEDAMEQALAFYEEGSADYADYLHLSLAKKGHALPFWTFDATASKAEGAKLLK